MITYLQLKQIVTIMHDVLYPGDNLAINAELYTSNPDLIFKRSLTCWRRARRSLIHFRGSQTEQLRENKLANKKHCIPGRNICI